MRISDWSSDVCSSDLQDQYTDDRHQDVPAAYRSQHAHTCRVKKRPVMPRGSRRSSTMAASSMATSPQTGVDASLVSRSEERRVGKERVITCTTRWSPYQ